MRRLRSWALGLGVVLAACSGSKAASGVEVQYLTTAGAIAIENLDQQIAQRGDEAGIEELLLVRSRFLGDYEALDRASIIAEEGSKTAGALLRRARVRSAVHRFADALGDVAAAERAGASGDEILGRRPSCLVATGHAPVRVRELQPGRR